MKSILVLIIFLLGFVFTASGQHEYAPMQEKKIEYKDWTYKNVRTGEDFNLREYTRDKKLVLIFYFAPWCHNSRYQTPFTEKLYEKYKDQGLGVIGVSLYSPIARVQTELDNNNITFPVVIETELQTDRQESLHYKYRQKAGDERKWGTPLNIFLVTKDLRRKGDLLIKRTYVVSGELIEAETEKFIRQTLGLPAEETGTEKSLSAANQPIEACEEEPAAEFKKPL